MSILRAEGLSKSYQVGGEQVLALREVTLEVQPGELIAVLGPSGSGKSTLLSLLAGLEPASAGEVWIEGEALSSLGDAALARLRRRKIGFVFQTFNLIPVLTVEENVALPFVLDGRPRREWKARVGAALEAMGLERRRQHLPERVSVGERQRAAIARAMVTEPRLIFADEPTGSLDSQRGEAVLKLLHRAREQSGATVILVTHDAQQAALASRLLRLHDGRLEASAG